MRTIAVISQKGGAGKNDTGTTHCGRGRDGWLQHCRTGHGLAGNGGSLVGVAQGSASRRSAGQDHHACPEHSKRFSRMALTSSSWTRPPVAEAEARTAAKTADLVLIPCRPNAFDVHSIKTTADLTRFAGKPAFAIFNAGPVAAARLYAETAELVIEIGLQVAPLRLSDRAAFRHSTGSGQTAQETEPGGKAAAEVGELWNWICQQVGMPPRKRGGMHAKVST